MNLTTDDKDWIVSTIRAILKEETGNMATNEALERVETSLLTAFHKWANPTEQKLRTHREALRALDLQIEEIAGRVV